MPSDYLEAADEIIAADHTSHDPMLPDLAPGPEGKKQFVSLYHDNLSDAHITIEDHVTRWTGHGTHSVVSWAPRRAATGRRCPE